MKTNNCSRCGKQEKRLKHIPNFNYGNLKEANLCKECLKWWEQVKLTESKFKPSILELVLIPLFLPFAWLVSKLR